MAILKYTTAGLFAVSCWTISTAAWGQAESTTSADQPAIVQRAPASVQVASSIPLTDAPAQVRQDLPAVAQAWLNSNLGAAGAGTPKAPPRIFEGTWQTYLLPADGRAAEAAVANRCVVNAWSDDDSVDIEMSFSHPVQAAFSRAGGWAVADVAGFSVAGEQEAPVGQTGLVTVKAKPGEQPGTARIGLTANDSKVGQMVQSADGLRVSITLGLPGGSFDLGVDDVLRNLGDVVRAEHGMASWYGGRFHGRRTASGERFDTYAMTAAHKTIRMGSYVRVTNVNNGKQVVVKINDRGPFVPGRIIDLSRAAAESLGILGSGVGRVRVELLSGKG